MSVGAGVLTQLNIHKDFRKLRDMRKIELKMLSTGDLFAYMADYVIQSMYRIIHSRTLQMLQQIDLFLA